MQNSNFKQPKRFRKLIDENTEYPIAMLAYYGPDDQTVTKISINILVSEDAEPITKHWYGAGVAEDKSVATEIGLFVQSYSVNQVIMTDEIIGCPHVEGIDYPVGEKCPDCTYWQGKT